jgi:hypothetical protein
MQKSMNNLTFSFDKLEWERLSEEEQEQWFDWAESCGADRQVELAERNSQYPDMICVPSVRLPLTDEEILKILEICEDPAPISEYLQAYLTNSS